MGCSPGAAGVSSGSVTRLPPDATTRRSVATQLARRDKHRRQFHSQPAVPAPSTLHWAETEKSRSPSANPGTPRESRCSQPQSEANQRTGETDRDALEHYLLNDVRSRHPDRAHDGNLSRAFVD